MEQKYSIKGIEKIISTAGKERLAQYYEVDIDADFESIITENFKELNIPNGLEVAFYHSLGPEEFNKAKEEGREYVFDTMKAASEVYEQDEKRRAMFGIQYMSGMPEFNDDFSRRMTGGVWGNDLFFFVDEPININDIEYRIKYMIGGVQYHGLMMGKGYYETHKSELRSASPDRSKIDAVNKYVENFMLEFENVSHLGGYGPRPEYEETEEIRKQKAEGEKVILELTGKSSIDELSLKDFIALKRRLKKEKQDLEQQFEEKFSKKNGERE